MLVNLIRYNDTAVYVGKEISIELRESLNQENKFSRSHVKFDGKLTVGQESMYFPYQCNPEYVVPEVDNILDCLLSDAYAYEVSKDIDDFAKEFGYEKISEAINAYNACKKTSEDLHRLFTEKELEELEQLAENGWEENEERE